MKALHEESEMAVNKITKTKYKVKQESVNAKRTEESTRCGYHTSQRNVQPLVKFAMSRKHHLSICAKHRSKKATLEKKGEDNVWIQSLHVKLKVRNGHKHSK